MGDCRSNGVEGPGSGRVLTVAASEFETVSGIRGKDRHIGFNGSKDALIPLLFG